MARIRALWFVVAAGLALALSGRAAVSSNLVFDAMLKEYKAKVGEMTAEFDFSLTNTGPEAVTINSVRASCGCTTPKLPTLPWKIEPGQSGSFHVTSDLRGKFGTFQKSIFIDTTEGSKMLYVKCQIPTGPSGAAAVPGMDARDRNMQLAQADRQIVFRGECASCHKPSTDLMGEKLFTATCAVCHEAEHRATMVPDLMALRQTPTEAYWEAWISNGKVGSLMPAFAQQHGGPLTDAQIASLVKYMMTDFPNRKPQITAHAAPAATTPSVDATPRPFTTVQPGVRPAQPTVVRPTPLPGSTPLIPPTPSVKTPPSPVPDNRPFNPEAK